MRSKVRSASDHRAEQDFDERQLWWIRSTTACRCGCDRGIVLGYPSYDRWGRISRENVLQAGIDKPEPEYCGVYYIINVPKINLIATDVLEYW